jgi:hypothetical protein
MIVALRNHFMAMQKLGLIGCLLALCLPVIWQARAQAIYYNTSSTVPSRNTLDSVSTNGGDPTTLFTAGSQMSHCTALAVDAVNGKLFLLDGPDSSLWSVNLDGSGLALIENGLTNFPTDLALDVQNRQIYFATSSTIQDNNTIQRVDYTGSNNATVFIATGSPADDAVSRCTAIAVDLLNSKIFVADAGAGKIWSMNLAGNGLVALAKASNSIPTGLALDVTNQQVYFTLSSPDQSSNFIQRVDYSGAGLITLFAASGGVERCTALDLDLAHDNIYLSDAGANTLWRIPISGGSATPVLSGLSATAKKVRWFSGTETLPPPDIISLSLSGMNAIFKGTNGFAGGTYYVLTSTNVALPFSQWSLIATSILSASGNFTVTATNGLGRNVPHQFYILRVQ